VGKGGTRATGRGRAVAGFGEVERGRGHLGEIDRRIAAQHRRADWWEGIAQDTRYVIRSLSRAPGFTAMVVVTLALGLGANAALFSLLDRLFLQTPAGVQEPMQLRRMYQHYTNRGVERWRARLSVPEVMAPRAAEPLRRGAEEPGRAQLVHDPAIEPLVPVRFEHARLQLALAVVAGGVADLPLLLGQLRVEQLMGLDRVEQRAAGHVAIDAGTQALGHTSAHHQRVADDLGVRWGFLEG